MGGRGVGVLLLVACGPRVGSESGSGTATSGSVVDPTEGAASTDADSLSGGAGPGSVGESVGSESLEGSSGSGDGDDGLPVGCDWGDGVIALERGITPDGEVALVDGAFGYDFCSGRPHIELYSDLDPTLPRSGVGFLVDWQEDGGAPFTGTWSMVPHGPGSGGGVGEVRFLEPLPSSATRLRAVLTMTEDGWDFEAEIDVPFCDGAFTCGCPCE